MPKFISLNNIGTTTQKAFIIFLLCWNFGFSQTSEKKQIVIDFAGFADKDEEKHPGAVILTRSEARQVQATHEGATLWCDQAIHYAQDNFIEAYGNVKIIQGDTVQMTSNYAEYSGKTQLAFAKENVILTDPNSKLTTEKLHFDRLKQEAYYDTGGTLVRDSSGVITSKIGRYFIKNQQYRFLENVKLNNPEYVLNTEWLDYYTKSAHAYMYGPSTITSKTSKVYTERGFYDTKKKLGAFIKNSKIYYDNRVLEGDSLFFNQARNFASATNNITVTDTLNNSVIKGHYAEVFKDKDSVFITKRALAITVQDCDSIYMHSDTIMITGKPEHRIIRAYYNVKLYKSDISGKADSVHVDQKKGLTKLINIARLRNTGAFEKPKKPILWNVKNQMTGDTIHLYSNTKTEALDSLVVFNNAFLASEDTLKAGFNQISGQKLLGFFNEDNKLNKVDIIKNAESIYFFRNDKNELIGIDKSQSASITIVISDNVIEEVRKITSPQGEIFPESKFPKNARLLRGFVWREDERPESVADLFSDDPPLNLPIIKGLDDALKYKPFFDENLLNRIEEADKAEQKRHDENSRNTPTNPKKEQLPSKASRTLPESIKDSISTSKSERKKDN